MDCVVDNLADGTRLMRLAVLNYANGTIVDIAVGNDISGQGLTRLLDRVARFRGYPAYVRTDNRREFASRAFSDWAQIHDVRHILIAPGRSIDSERPRS